MGAIRDALPSRPFLEDIEERILYSADVIPVDLADAGLAGQAEVQVFTPAAAGASTAEADSSTAAKSERPGRHELVFIDRSAADYEALVADIIAQGDAHRTLEVVLIDSGADGIGQVSEVLSRQDGVDAVHFITHGSEATIQLGASVLDLNALMQRADEIQAWSGALTPDADLLLYGCDIAGSSEGEMLVQGLAQLTGADVAASTDITGSALFGGDWTLEYQAGAIETTVAISTSGQQTWQAALADTVLVSYEPAFTDLDPFELKADQSWGQSFVFDSPGATYSVDKIGLVLSRDALVDVLGQAITVSLRSTWTGAAIASGTLSSTTLTGAEALVTINLTSAATLNDNQSYFIRIDVDGLLGGIYVGVDPSGTYPGGDLINKDGNAESGKDMAFRLIDTIPTVLHAFEPSFAVIHDHNIKAGDALGQTVTFDSAGPTYSVDTIDLILYRRADADLAQIITVSLRSSFNGAAIASGTVSAASLGTTEAWVRVALTSAATLNENQTYFIHVASSGGDERIRVGVDDDNYAGGVFIDGNGNVRDDDDMAFRLIDSTGANTAPVLSGSGNLSTIDEDPVTNNGTLVSSLIAGQVTDLDAGAALGIAVTSVNNANGTWQYSIDSGSIWLNFGNPSQSSSRLLAADANTFVRFVPNANFNGTVANGLTFRAFDQASGTNGTTGDADQNGGGTAYSAATASASVTINAVNDAPVITSNGGGATASVTRNENATAVTTVTRSDVDGDPPAFSITGGADAALFTINTSTGVLAFVAAPNFEAPTDSGGDNGYDVTVQVSDGAGGIDTQAITVSVLDVDEFNASAIADTDPAVNQVTENVAVGTTTGITAFASDADGTNNAITYSLTNNAGGRFAINATTGVVTVAGGINRETAASHAITARASSADGSSSTQGFTITVNDVDEFDVGAITDANGAANQVAENAASGTTVRLTASATDADATTNAITYSLDDNAGGRFAINSSTGVVTVADGTLLDREAAASHAITVRAISADASFSTQAFTINLTDVDEFDVGAIADANGAADQVAENAANGTSVGVTALAGADADATNNAITYSLDVSAGGRFAINASSGVVTVANGTLLNREAAASHAITTRATSADGSFSTQAFTIALTDVDEFNVGAVTDGNAAANQVAENAANGTSVSITASAADADATTNAITYSLDVDAGGRFAINASTGVVTVANGSLLDREAAVSHAITARATSADGSFSTQAFTINLTDVDEFDVGAIADADGGADQVAENAANGATVGITASASDADATTNAITYSLDDNAGGRFAINSSTGVVTVADGTLLDREAAASHAITVRATSADASFSTQAFTINLTDVDEFNVGAIADVNGAADQVDENSANGTLVGITASATDADATTNAVTYALTNSAGGRFAINASTGVVTVAGSIDVGDGFSQAITVRASSADGSFSTQGFTIAVNDVDEFDVGAVSDTNGASNQVAENAANGAGVGITAFANDPDATTNAITYTLDASAGGRFAIGASSGVVTVASSSMLDREAAASHAITVRATSADASFSTQAFTISLTDVDEFDVGAVADVNGAANEVVENAANGTSVGLTASASDADATSNAISYTLDANAGGRFAINDSTGAVTVANASLLDREAAASHAVTVRATSADGSFSTQAFTINLTDADEFDVGAVADANVAANQVAENAANGTAVGITAAASDADATTNAITYALDVSAGGRFAIDASTGVVTVANGGLLDREAAASHAVTVRATSTDGSFTTQSFAIALTDVSEFAVSAISDTDAAAETLPENASIGAAAGIQAFASDADAATNAVTYTLDDDAGGRFAIDASTGAVTLAGTLDFETQSTHAIIVRATSADASFATRAFTISVTDVSEDAVGPISDANAASNQVTENAANGTAVGVTASATDSDPTDTVSYSLTNSAGGRFAINASSGVMTVANGALLDREAAASHSITVRADSLDGSFSTRTFSISLTDVDEFNAGTIVDANGAGNQVAENAANGASVGITAFASDADATTNAITYSLDDSAGGRFAVNAATGVVTVADGTLLDREAALSHAITVRASSADGSFSTQAFTIDLSDADEFDVGAVADVNGSTDQVAENAASGTTVGITASASDVDATATAINYSLDDNAGGRFAIDGSSGVVTVTNGTLLDREATASHAVIVRASSADGSFSTRAFTINLTDTDEFDVGAVSDSDGTTNQVAENAVNGSVVGVTAFAADSDATTNAISYSLDVNAGGRFTIDAATGIVSVANGSLLDREAAASHAVTVRATSTDGSFSTQSFTLGVTDVDEFDIGVISDTDGAANTIPETAASGSVVGLTASAADADATTNTVSFSLDDNAGGRFAIDSATGVVMVAGALDFETQSTHSITVRATSADGSFVTGAFTISVTDVSETAVGPISDANPTANQVAENAANGTAVGVTASATDPDASDTLTYSLDNTAGGRFAINAATGAVAVADGTLLDREAAVSHAVMVRATSTDGSFTTQGFTIALTDVNEFGVSAISDTDAAPETLPENASVGTAAGIRAFASDADVTTNTVSYSLDNDGGGRFAIGLSSGVVTLAGVLDFEAQSSHAITVRASSADASFATRAFTITVTDVSESSAGPVSDANSAANQVAENAASGTAVGITASASDPDVTDTISYSLTDDAGGRFTINVSTGAVTVANSSLLDREAASSHTITARASSTDGSFSSQAFTIGLADVDEFDVGAVSDTDSAANRIAENAVNDSVVGLTAFAQDADATGSAIIYSLDDSAGGRFTIDAATGVVAVADGSLLDREAAASHALTVRASSADGSFSQQSFTVDLNDLNDNAPVITSDGGGASASLAVAENELAVTTVSAVDGDSPSQLTYSIAGGADAARFTMDTASGALRFAIAPDFEAPADADGDNVYAVTVRSSDGTLSDSQFLSIVVGDVNEAPVITTNAMDVSEGGTIVLTGANMGSTDPDANTAQLTYTVANVTGGRFEDAGAPNVSLSSFSNTDVAAGRVRFVHDGNEAAPAYSLSVSDGAAGTGSQPALITFTNVNDVPTLAIDVPAAVAGADLRFTSAMLNGADPDSSAASLVYTVTGVQDGRFESTGNPGVTVSTFTQAEVDAGTVRLVQLGSGVTTFNVTMSDGVASVGPIGVTTQFQPISAPSASQTAALDASIIALAQTAPAASTASESAAAITQAIAQTSTDTNEREGGAAGANPDAAAALLQAQGRTALSSETVVGEVEFRSTPVQRMDAFDGRSTRSDFSALARTALSQSTGEAALLPEASTPAESRKVMTLSALETLRNRQSLVELDELRNQIEEPGVIEKRVVATSIALTTGLSIGYVLWLVRSGVLLGSVLSALPAWQVLDPLPVLGNFNKGDEDGAGDDESERLFDRRPAPATPPPPPTTPPPSPTLPSLASH